MTFVSPTLKPIRASLTFGNGVEGRVEAYSSPLPGISLRTRKGAVFELVPKCGSGSLGGRSSPGGQGLACVSGRMFALGREPGRFEGGLYRYSGFR